MTNLRTAAQQALEALTLSIPKPRPADDDYAELGWKEHNAAITALRAALAVKSLAGILLREHDNIEQAIRYAERMAQRCADSRSLMAMEYQDAAKELKSWKQSKPL